MGWGAKVKKVAKEGGAARPPESSVSYEKVAATVADYFNIPEKEFFIVGEDRSVVRGRTVPHLRIAVVSERGDILMVNLFPDGGIMLMLVPPSTGKEASLAGNLVIERDFSKFTETQTFTIGPSGIITKDLKGQEVEDNFKNPELVEILEEACDRMRFKPIDRVIIPKMLQAIRTQIFDILGTKPRKISESMKKRAAAYLIMNFSENYPDLGSFGRGLIAISESMEGQDFVAFYAAFSRGFPEMDPTICLEILKYSVDNFDQLIAEAGLASGN